MNTIKIYRYENCDIRNINGEPRFVMVDEIGNLTIALERLDENEITLSSIEGYRARCAE